MVRMADQAQYARPAIPEEQRGQIRVRLLNATPDPLGSIAALCAQYEGRVVRSLSEVTDEERRSYLDDMGKTVLSGPLEAAQFHFQIEGVTRSITHQMVRSRASFFAQESLRFAVPEGNWSDEIPKPPSLSGIQDPNLLSSGDWERLPQTDRDKLMMVDTWNDAMINAQSAYELLIRMGMPAEEARGVLPHDMPTRIHWVCDLRTLLAEAGKRTCTQAQFPWRIMFAGIAKELRAWGTPDGDVYRPNQGPERVTGDGWQFREIANKLRPVCFQTGSCGFMAKFDRSCSIRERVDAFSREGIAPAEWGEEHEIWVHEQGDEKRLTLLPIRDIEWAANPAAARS
jgi:flavin-dependent thymidylate synthase